MSDTLKPMTSEEFENDLRRLGKKDERLDRIALALQQRERLLSAAKRVEAEDSDEAWRELQAAMRGATDDQLTPR